MAVSYPTEFVSTMHPGIPDNRALLLQGPVGPFFARLQEALDGHGWTTAKIQFNGGDRSFHGSGMDVPFTDHLNNWPAWLEAFLADFKPAVIILFGDQRPIHRDAIRIAEKAGVAVVSFEEGYLRPDYITMEAGGNNALSPLRNALADTNITPDILPPQAMRNNGFKSTAIMATRYFVTMTLGHLQFPYYQHHRKRGLMRETFMWNRNAFRKWKYRMHNLQSIHDIVEKLDKSYFVVALQVHDDLQLRCHGCGWTLEKLIESTIASFAKSGLPSNHLVFKAHPLDRGHSSTREAVRKLSKLFRIADRVHYVDDGSLGLLARHSRGMVTINSTSAITSFGCGRPVFALGNSFYEAMTANGGNRSLEALGRFWRVTPAFDHRRWDNLRAHIIHRSQINGSFYLEEEIARTCQRVIQRLQQYVQSSALLRPRAAEVVHLPEAAKKPR